MNIDFVHNVLLAMGPGSISVALTLGAIPESSVRSLLVTAAAHALGILIVALIVFICYRHADAILDRLGPRAPPC